MKGEVIHELRNSIAIAREEVSQILDGMFGPVPKGQQQALSMVLKQIGRLGRMIENLSRPTPIGDAVEKKILVVDDEVDLVAAIKARLEKSGYQVIPAYNGKEAVKAVSQEKPDAVILDIRIPKPDGLKVLRKIRTRNKKLPVFILTGLKDKERFAMARRLNASGFILKTNDLKEELKHITSILRISEGYRHR